MPASPRRTAVRWLRGAGAAGFALCCLALAAPAAAQDPVPPPVPEPQDTVPLPDPPDVAEPDTVPAAPPDSLLPAPALPAFPAERPSGFAAAAWEWRSGDLHRLRGVTLLELLGRVPGLLITQPHGFGQPAGVAAFGLGGGRVRVFRDGYELDPMGAAVLHLQHLELTDLDAVRVERSLLETRIELTTFRLENRQPHSVVEAGTGAPNLRMLRGAFARPVGGRTALLAGFDMMDTQGPLAGPPSSLAHGLLRLTYELTPAIGAEVEMRRGGSAFGAGPYAQDFSRGDLLLRTRAAPAPGAAFEAVLGRSWRTPADDDSLHVDTRIDQAMLRAALERQIGWLEGTARLRRIDDGAYPAPTSDLTLRAGVAPVPMLAAHAEARLTGGEAGGTELGGTARVGPFAGFSLFGSFATGTRAVGLAHDTVRLVPPDTGTAEPDTLRITQFRALASELRGRRLGAQWARGTAAFGAALLRSDADVVVPFGLPFDAGVEPPPVRTATGYELFASTPLFTRELRLEGSLTRWTDTGNRPYQPLQEARAALVFHELYYTANLEPMFRVELLHRGSSLAPEMPIGTFDEGVPPYTLVNAYVQIRVIDVRAYLAWENILNEREAIDIPGAPRGQRVHYGVRWTFRN